MLKPFSQDWHQALGCFEGCLTFIGSFVTHLLLDNFLRDSVMTKHWIKLRQALVDTVVWRKAVVTFTAGHLAGLAASARSSGVSRSQKKRDHATIFVTA